MEIVVSKICRKITPDLKRPLCMEYFLSFPNGDRLGPSYVSFNKKWCKPVMNAENKWHQLVLDSNFGTGDRLKLKTNLNLVPLHEDVVSALEHAIAEYYLLNAK
jgi:hypothetical protein